VPDSARGVVRLRQPPVLAFLGEGERRRARLLNRQRVRLVAVERENRLVTQAERRLVERALEIAVDQKHARLALDARVQVAARRRLLADQQLHRRGGALRLETHREPWRVEPEVLDVGGLLVDDGIDFERLEVAEQLADFARVRRHGLGRDDFPHAVLLPERRRLTGLGLDVDLLELRRVGCEDLVLLDRRRVAGRRGLVLDKKDVRAERERHDEQNQ
jgi:hypothetical protein